MLNKEAIDRDHFVDLNEFCLNEFGEDGPVF